STSSWRKTEPALTLRSRTGGASGVRRGNPRAGPEQSTGGAGMRLGLVTYNLARDWDIPTIIARCRATGFAGVELRTTHAHGVESSLTETERQRVRGQFAESEVRLCSLGTAFEFHAVDPAEVARNVAGTKEYVRLARDVGAVGVKVRPNGLQVEAGV